MKRLTYAPNPWHEAPHTVSVATNTGLFLFTTNCRIKFIWNQCRIKCFVTNTVRVSCVVILAIFWLLLIEPEFATFSFCEVMCGSTTDRFKRWVHVSLGWCSYFLTARVLSAQGSLWPALNQISNRRIKLIVVFIIFLAWHPSSILITPKVISNVCNFNQLFDKCQYVLQYCWHCYDRPF